MANQIKIKRSSIQGKVPSITDLELGELAINTRDGKLFLKRNDGVADYIQEIGGGGVSATWVRKVADYTATSGDQIIADTGGGAFTIILPASPTVGAFVTVVDGGNWKTTNLIISRNGSTIENLSENLVLDIPGIRVDFIYDGSTWEVYTLSGPSTSIIDDTTTNTTQYLTMSRTNTGMFDSGYVATSKLHFNPATGVLNSTDFNSLSDIRSKENIQTITNALDMVCRMRGVTFQWKDTHRPGVGVIAQELETVVPQAVSTSNTGEKSVSYGNLIGILIEAIKAQQEEIEELKKWLH